MGGATPSARPAQGERPSPCGDVRLTRVTTPRPPLDVWRFLAAVDAASPAEAVDAFSSELGIAFGAEAVAFLIADVSGRALTRLSHVPLRAGVDGNRRESEEVATTIPFDGGPAEQALRTQTVQVLVPGVAQGPP